MNALADGLRAEADALEALAVAKRAQADALDHAPTVASEAEYVTVDDAARVFEVSRRTIFAWLGAGAPSTRRGKLRRVNVEAMRAWLDERGAAR